MLLPGTHASLQASRGGFLCSVDRVALELTCYGIILRGTALDADRAEAILQAIATVAPDLGFDMIAGGATPLAPGDAIASHPLVASLDKAGLPEPAVAGENAGESAPEEEGQGTGLSIQP